VIGVQMGVDHHADRVAALFGKVQVRLNVEGRIDDDGFTGLARGDEVGGTAEIVVQELLEVHGPGSLWKSYPPLDSTDAPGHSVATLTPTVQNSLVTDKTLNHENPEVSRNRHLWAFLAPTRTAIRRSVLGRGHSGRFVVWGDQDGRAPRGG
jgi:hypothetical protein